MSFQIINPDCALLHILMLDDDFIWAYSRSVIFTCSPEANSAGPTTWSPVLAGDRVVEGKWATNDDDFYTRFSNSENEIETTAY